MEPHRNSNLVDSPPAKTPPPAEDLRTPAFLDALRAAMQSVTHQGGSSAPPHKEVPQPARWKSPTKLLEPMRGQLWQITGAVLVSTAAFAGVYVYMTLTAEFSSIGKELGTVRRELGLVRNEVVRKDEFNGRYLAAQSLIKEVESSSRSATESALQRNRQQKQALADQELRLKEVRRDLERLQERLAGLEKK